MDFRSDNAAGAAPEILSALGATNVGSRTPYGEDQQTRQVVDKLRQLFECDLEAFFVGTGTAANALGLSLLTPPYGVVYCHEGAHINTDECGAPEFYTAGAKLCGLPGADAKINAAQISALLPGHLGSVHNAQPAAVSLTQATEAGTCYRPEEIAAIAAIAHQHGLRVHMDGARFANAVAHLNLSPATITWRAGVDVLSFGATKNGALAAEAVLIFDRQLAQQFAYRRKRAGQLWSKHRFLSAQLDAYLHDQLWLRLARHANAMAQQLAAGLGAVPGAHLCHPVEANEVFVTLPEAVILGLQSAGFQFYRWPDDRSNTLRLVAAFDTRAADVQALIEAAQRAAGRNNSR